MWTLSADDVLDDDIVSLYIPVMIIMVYPLFIKMYIHTYMPYLDIVRGGGGLRHSCEKQGGGTIIHMHKAHCPTSPLGQPSLLV